MAKGPFSGRVVPASTFAAVTPHDTNPIPGGPCRGLYIGGGGNIVVRDALDNEVTFASVPAGTVLPVAATGVSATGTGATGIVALF